MISNNMAINNAAFNVDSNDTDAVESGSVEFESPFASLEKPNAKTTDIKDLLLMLQSLLLDLNSTIRKFKADISEKNTTALVEAAGSKKTGEIFAASIKIASKAANMLVGGGLSMGVKTNKFSIEGAKFSQEIGNSGSEAVTAGGDINRASQNFSAELQEKYAEYSKKVSEDSGLNPSESLRLLNTVLDNLERFNRSSYK